jgi:rhodanese-related sulfurtransferase
MRFIPARLSELPRDRPIVAYCAAGVRSLYVAEFLLAQGYGDVKSLAGGMIAWQATGQ